MYFEKYIEPRLKEYLLINALWRNPYFGYAVGDMCHDLEEIADCDDVIYHDDDTRLLEIINRLKIEKQCHYVLEMALTDLAVKQFKDYLEKNEEFVKSSDVNVKSALIITNEDYKQDVEILSCKIDIISRLINDLTNQWDKESEERQRKYQEELSR